MKKNFLAIDLGASSGRAILGTLDKGKIALKELHRFPNGPVTINGGLFWDILSLFTEIKKNELISIYSAGIESERTKVIELLSRINPSLSNDWNTIKAQN